MEDITSVSSLTEDSPRVDETMSASTCKLLSGGCLQSVVWPLANGLVAKATGQLAIRVSMQVVHGGVLPEYAVTRPIHVWQTLFVGGNNKKLIKIFCVV